MILEMFVVIVVVAVVLYSHFQINSHNFAVIYAFV
jgi:hypothetical protein